MLFRPRQPKDGREHDLEPRVSMGMFVGSGTRISDVFIMTARGVVKGNSITRRPWRLQAREPGEVKVDLPVVVGQPVRAPQEEVIPRNLYAKVRPREVRVHAVVSGLRRRCAICLIVAQAGMPAAHSRGLDENGRGQGSSPSGTILH